MMRRVLRRLGVAAVVALWLWTVAPAISLERYAPEAEEFRQALPSALRVVRSAEPMYLTQPVEAPGRFDAVGIAGGDEPVELRVRESGGEWSGWVELDPDQPLWAGGADEVQARSHHGPPEGELSYVNVSGDASLGDRLLNGVREAVNSAVITVGSIAAGESAVAAPPKPLIAGRRSWDPEGQCVPRKRAEYGVVKGAVIHHTVSAVKYAEESVPSMVLAICLYHRNTNGWNDIGYNALVDQFGNLYAGRAGGLNRPVIGAHAQGYNAQTTGVASIGTHTKIPLTVNAMKAATRLLAWKLSRHAVPALGKTTLVSAGGSVNRYPEGTKVRAPRISGHTTLNLTECPGGSLIGQLPALRKRVAYKIKQAGGPPAEPGPEPEPDGGTGSGDPPPSDGGVSAN